MAHPKRDSDRGARGKEGPRPTSEEGYARFRGRQLGSAGFEATNYIKVLTIVHPPTVICNLLSAIDALPKIYKNMYYIFSSYVM